MSIFTANYNETVPYIETSSTPSRGNSVFSISPFEYDEMSKEIEVLLQEQTKLLPGLWDKGTTSIDRNIWTDFTVPKTTAVEPPCPIVFASSQAKPISQFVGTTISHELNEPTVSDNKEEVPLAKIKPDIKTTLYKTEMCDTFQSTGDCPYGNKCQFAHGKRDLRRVDRGSKYKTKACINWMRTGSCKYGKRCCFRHDVFNDW